MAAKTSWHRYGTKFRHPVYTVDSTGAVADVDVPLIHNGIHETIAKSYAPPDYPPESPAGATGPQLSASARAAGDYWSFPPVTENRLVICSGTVYRHAHTHTHTHTRLTALCLGPPR